MVDDNPQDTMTDIKLAELLTRQTVQAHVTARNWEDATDQVGNLLVKAGRIEPSYIQAMKRVLKEMGPYAVIAPGIVLLHARPEEGVLEACLGLITLATPVEFGHSENDPVDLVFALGAKDKKAHIIALQQLAELLGNEQALDELRSARDADELVNVIRKWS